MNQQSPTANAMPSKLWIQRRKENNDSPGFMSKYVTKNTKILFQTKRNRPMDLMVSGIIYVAKIVVGEQQDISQVPQPEKTTTFSIDLLIENRWRKQSVFWWDHDHWWVFLLAFFLYLGRRSFWRHGFVKGFSQNIWTGNLFFAREFPKYENFKLY